ELAVVEGAAPGILDAVAAGHGMPDALFVGGGVGGPGVLDACWQHLKPGGRLVAHAVTLDGEAALLAWRSRIGGELMRMSMAQAEPIGPHFGWRPAMPVTQWVARKPLA